MLGFIFGLIVGGFGGMPAMSLCVICRDRKIEKTIDECEEDYLWREK